MVSSFCGIGLSGSGGTRSVELESGHAPGKEGVGERTTIEKEKGGSSFWDKERDNDMIPFDYLVGALQCTFDSARYALSKVVDVLPV